jgi:hypothetical protein
LTTSVGEPGVASTGRVGECLASEGGLFFDGVGLTHTTDPALLKPSPADRNRVLNTARIFSTGGVAERGGDLSAGAVSENVLSCVPCTQKQERSNQACSDSVIHTHFNWLIE